MAVVLLLVAMTTTVRAVAWLSAGRSAADRRSVAIREADNLLDRLTAGRTGEPSLSDEAGRELPGGEVQVERVVEPAGGVAMERITVTVRYRERPGVPAAPVRLSTWIAAASAPGDEDSGEDER